MLKANKEVIDEIFIEVPCEGELSSQLGNLSLGSSRTPTQAYGGKSRYKKRIRKTKKRTRKTKKRI